MLIPLFYYMTYRQLFGYGVWGTLWRNALSLGIIMYFFGAIMMVRLSEQDFWCSVTQSINVVQAADGPIETVRNTPRRAIV